MLHASQLVGHAARLLYFSVAVLSLAAARPACSIWYTWQTISLHWLDHTSRMWTGATDTSTIFRQFMTLLEAGNACIYGILAPMEAIVIAQSILFSAFYRFKNDSAIVWCWFEQSSLSIRRTSCPHGSCNVSVATKMLAGRGTTWNQLTMVCRLSLTEYVVKTRARVLLSCKCNCEIHRRISRCIDADVAPTQRSWCSMVVCLFVLAVTRSVVGLSVCVCISSV